MACPACGCKETYQYDGWCDHSDDCDGMERCAACGVIFDVEDHAPEDGDEHDEPPTRQDGESTTGE